MKKVLAGFEIKTGEKVFIKPDHLLVTGVTQYSGKTTCLESLIQRIGIRAVVFRTKLGEKSFIHGGTIIPPFFKDKSDWQFIQSLLEATIGEKLKGWDRSKIIQLSKGTKGLLDFKKNVDEALLNEKLRAFDKDILINLQAYLELVLPKLQSVQFTNELELVEGINIIDLERFSRDLEVQSLIIRSVVEEVFYKYKNTIIVLPEAPKFLPQKRGNPCKVVVEQFIREGATDNKLLWVDSQDMASTDKTPLKQISTWILGYQSESNEVKHTLGQIPLPPNKKPKPNDIMTLKLGEFYICTRDFVKKTYIQPFWLDEKKAKDVALGKIKVSELDAPESLAPFKIAVKKPESIVEQPAIDFSETTKRFNKEMNEIRKDFFDKIEDIQEQINKIHTNIFELKNQPKAIELDEKTIINKLLQKLPAQSSGSVDQEAIIQSVLARVPKQAGSVVYEVAPLEKIKKDFLEEAKQKVLSDISALSSDEKKALKYIESRNIEITNAELITNCFKLKAGGSAGTKISTILSTLRNVEAVEKKGSGRTRGRLKQKIVFYLSPHEGTEQEIQQVYDHILMEILSKEGK